MNLLPGLRELRAPLVSGYLWLISAWLFLGERDWLPTKRPLGNGEVARLWDLGGTLGKTVVLAAVTFIAYLVGSFLEMDPDGRIATFLRPAVLVDRRPWYRRPFIKDQRYQKLINSLNATEIRYAEFQGETVAQSISTQARRNLVDAFEQRNMLPETLGPIEPHPAYPSHYDEELRRTYDIAVKEWTLKHSKRDERRLTNEIVADGIMHGIIAEIQQLASRLLVKDKDLYGKYDRQMAEASVRMNVSIPLTVLLLLATWLSNLRLWPRVTLTIVILAFGYMLLRQGYLRAMSARDVIAQALIIGEVESRYMPKEKASEAASQQQADSKENPRPSEEKVNPAIQ